MSMLSRDIIILPEDHGCWLVMNVFTRTCLGMNTAGLDCLRAESRQVSSAEIKIWDIGRFSNVDGLLADPTCYLRDSAKWSEPSIVSAESFLALCRKKFILIDDVAAYRARFALKTDLLDGTHFGNFHQQHGQHLLLKERVKSEEWWLAQKFNEDFTGIRPNLYQAIQENYLKKYFKIKFTGQPAVVDIGCGTGYYANLMAEAGAFVTGIDPTLKYLDIARKKAAPNARFELMDVKSERLLSSVPDHSADYAFMSDAMLFYFAVPVGKPFDLQVLLKEVRRILKPGGTFISVEPHYIFWLLPWLGEKDRPFTVLTEYLHKNFHVTAYYSQLIQAWSQGGFAVSWMDEMRPHEDFKKNDQRAFSFADEFPLWQLFELRQLGSS